LMNIVWLICHRVCKCRSGCPLIYYPITIKLWRLDTLAPGLFGTKIIWPRTIYQNRSVFKI
ncbi:ABC-type Fe3+ transport system, periplasmic component domain protein, partial [Vibrio parahaemolyticus AQ3810]